MRNVRSRSRAGQPPVGSYRAPSVDGPGSAQGFVTAPDTRGLGKAALPELEVEVDDLCRLVEDRPMELD
jgi:hypothetical protein